MKKAKTPVAFAVIVLLATASLHGCAATDAKRRLCNVSSPGCMALKAQQTKTGTIAGQNVRCCG